MHFVWDDGVVNSGNYAGGTISVGDVLAKRVENAELEMLYHGATTSGEQNAGKARARFVQDNNGRTHMCLDWEWLTGDGSQGQSEWLLI